VPRNPPWTPDELVLALDLYLPDRRVLDEIDERVIELSQLLNELPIHRERGTGNFRSPDAVVMKLANFRRLDPSSESAGLDAGSHLDAEAWDRFANDERTLRRRAREIRALPRSIAEWREWATPEVERVAIEAMNVERTETRIEQHTMILRRREQRMVRTYADYLAAQGRTPTRRRIIVGKPHGSLFCDLFEEERRNLVEAKAVADRPAIRMAIGQLADYARFCEEGVHRAILLPLRPDPDLEALLSDQRIAVVWETPDGFKDNASGGYT
jgi:hypothetical protein